MTPISRAMRTSLSSEPYNVFKINPQEISGQRDRFTSALTSLTEDMDGYLKPLVELFDKEEHGVEEAQQEGSKRAARRMLLKLIISRVTAFLTIWLLDERHPSSFLSIPALPSMRRLHGQTLIILMLMQWWTAYGVGHIIALEKASSAGKRTDTSSRKNALKEAYLYEAFAAHYITDLFSSGHCRVPRRKLHNGSYASAVGGKIWGNDSNLDFLHQGSCDIDFIKRTGDRINDDQCRYMHDDDSATGVLVSNVNGQEWIAYGDKQFFLPHNALNRDYR
ncbi:MAG: hypothetical protein MMC23_005598 [Stictis urceolatum]|nr:hypothetical protein [Stictis urceolata]